MCGNVVSPVRIASSNTVLIGSLRSWLSALLLTPYTRLLLPDRTPGVCHVHAIGQGTGQAQGALCVFVHCAEVEFNLILGVGYGFVEVLWNPRPREVGQA